MFIKVNSDQYVNLNHTKEIYLEKTRSGKFRWVFVSGYGTSTESWDGRYTTVSPTFETEREANVWFNESIRPFIDKYNKEE